MKQKPLTNKSGYVRELKREDIRAMRPASEVLPKNFLAVLSKAGNCEEWLNTHTWSMKGDCFSRPGVKNEYDSLNEEFDYLVAKAKSEAKKCLRKSDIQKTLEQVRKEN